MKITAVASVQETKQVFSAEDDFEIIKNKLQIKVSIKRKSVYIKLSVYNFCLASSWMGVLLHK